MENRTALGYFWYNKIQQRPFYSTYTLKKGKKKGWLRVEYLDSNVEGLKLRKILIHPTDVVKWITEI